MKLAGWLILLSPTAKYNCLQRCYRKTMIKHPATNGCLMQRDFGVGLKDFHQQTPARGCLAIACLSASRASGFPFASAPRSNRAGVSDVYSRHSSSSKGRGLPKPGFLLGSHPEGCHRCFPLMPLSRLRPAPLSTSVLFIWKSHSFHKVPWDWDAFPTHLGLADSHY